MAFLSWSSLPNSIFTTGAGPFTGQHWDRLQVDENGGAELAPVAPVWVGTATPAASYSLANPLTYTFYATVQDGLGNQQPVTVPIATTTMVFPFLNEAGTASASAIKNVRFYDLNSTGLGGAIWFENDPSLSWSDDYVIKYRPYTTYAGNVTSQSPALSLGAEVTLVGFQRNLVEWEVANTSADFAVAWVRTSTAGPVTNYLLEIEIFDTAGNCLSDINSGVYADALAFSIAPKLDGTAYLFAHYGASSGGALVVKSIVPNGSVADVATISTPFTNVLDLEIVPLLSGNFLLFSEGTLGANHQIIASLYSSTGTQIGSSTTYTLASGTPAHWEAMRLTASDDVVLVFEDGSVKLAQFASDGTQVGATTATFMPVYEDVRPLGDGRIEIVQRAGLGGNATDAVGYIFDARATGQTINGTSVNNILAGTPFGDIVNAGAGNDKINASFGSDVLNGGAGRDTAFWSGVSSASISALVHNADGTTSITALGSNGVVQTDVFSSIEALRLTDKTISLKVVTGNDFAGLDKSSILFRNTTTGTLGYWTTTGGAPAWTVIGAASPAYVVAGTGDVTGDGRTDIVFRNTSTGDTGYYRMDSGAPVWVGLGASSLAYTIAGVADFTGDGTADILWRNNTNGDTGYYKMDSGSAQWTSVGPSSPAYTVVGVGDFNGDTVSDILFRNNSTGDTGYYRMGGATPVWVSVGASSTAYTVVGTGDYTGDGTSDILWRNAGNGDTGFYKMDSGTPQWVSLGLSSTAYTVVGSGFYDANATSDILWRNNATGAVGYYAMTPGTGAPANWVHLGGSSTSYQVQVA